MKLSTFILDNIEQILQGWEDFAKTIFPKSQQTSTNELRDHSKQMLLVIADDLNHLNSSDNQQDTAAEEHGISRLGQGFTINEMALEYQALRKSVMDLYGKKLTQLHPDLWNQAVVFKDIIEFNESIDRSLCEAIASYSSVKEQQTHLFNTMLSSSPVLSYILDLNGSFLYVNKAMSDLYQQPVHELLGKAHYNLAMPAAAAIREHIQAILDTKTERHGELVVQQSPNAPTHFFEYVYAPVFDNNDQIIAIAGMSRDITKQKEAEAQIWHDANYDDLTGLASRRRFRDKLDEAIKHSRRADVSFALLFIDLDKFKRINDRLGHDSGDLFLKKIAQRIKACVRDTDVVARLGGDEFAIILTGCKDCEHAKLITEKLLSEIKKPLQIKKTSITTMASIGTALCPQDANTPDALLGLADKAMYAAKKLGGNRSVFYKRAP